MNLSDSSPTKQDMVQANPLASGAFVQILCTTTKMITFYIQSAGSRYNIFRMNGITPFHALSCTHT